MQPVAAKAVRILLSLLASAAVTLATALTESARAATKPASCKSISAGHLCGATSGPLEATMVPSTHQPKATANWPLEVTATLSGKPAHASAAYQFLFGGAVVSTQYPRSDKHFTFVGHFSDELVFPKTSVGYPLTLQVAIKDGSHTVDLDWPIDVVK